MKRIYLFLLFAGLISSCDDDTKFERVTVAEPIFMAKADLRAQVAVEEPVAIEASGKFYFYRDLIFVTDAQRGIHVIDNANPESPRKISFLRVPGNFDVEVKDDILYADSYSDLVLFDISNINQIVHVDTFEDVFGNTNYILPAFDRMVEDVDYAGFDWGEHFITGWQYKTEFRERVHNSDEWVSFENVSSDASGGSGQGGSFARFKVVQDHLYIVDHSLLYAFDISAATEPQLKSAQNIGWDIETIFSQEGYLYIGSATGMLIYDIADVANPVYTSEIRHWTGCDPVVVKGDYAYLTLRGGNDCGQDLSFLEVIDVSDKSNPSVVARYDMEEPYGLGITNDRLYVSDGAHGLHIYDRTDPVYLQLMKVMPNLYIYDVIPLEDKLLMIGGGVLFQYSYTADGLEEISAFSLN